MFEDNHLLVVNKPALIPTMGVDTSRPSLVCLAKDYLKRKYNKPGKVFLGVVSRLDAFVSGVIVFARTSKAAARLNDQFRNRSAIKTYWAIVPAKRQLDSDHQLVHWLVKDEANHRMISVPENRAPELGAKLARLSFTKIGQFEGNCLVEIQLETGRKHQIRAQFGSIGCPIAGDRKYGSKQLFRRGIALHSQSLTIRHPTLPESMTFSKPPPKWWNLDKYRER